MKRFSISRVTATLCLSLAVLAIGPILAGPPSGGRSHGANAWGGGATSYPAPAPVGAAPVAATAAVAGAATTPPLNGGYYYAPDAAPGGGAALLAVQVPANAEIWLNDYKTKSTGKDREFVSPPLSGEMNFRYHVRVRWTENGQAIVQERDVPVAPGTRTSVRFGG